MATPLAPINIQLENSDLGQVFKDKINGLVTALNENRTEFNNQLAASETAGQFSDNAEEQVTLAADQVEIARQHKEAAANSAAAANATVAGTHTHNFSGVTGLQAALDQITGDLSELNIKADQAFVFSILGF